MTVKRTDALPHGWARTTLGDVLPLSYGKGLTEKHRDDTGSVPVYGSSGWVGSHSEALTSGPTLVVGRKGSIGASYYSPAACWPIDTTYFVETTQSTDLLWFRYLLEALNLGALDRSTTIPGLSRDDYNVVSVALAPLPEQHRIVQEIEKQLTRLEAAVAALERARAKLKRYRASVLRAACEGRLVPTEAELARAEGREYDPADQLLTRILKERRAKWEADQLAKMRSVGGEPRDDRWKAKYQEPPAPDTSNLPSLPKGWIWTSIGQVFQVFVGATPSRAQSDYWSGEIPWVSSGEVAFCTIHNTRERITEAGLRNTSTDLHPPGTVLLGMIGEGRTRGQTAILALAACNNQNSAAIRVSEAGLPAGYLYRFLESEYENTRRIGSGNNQPALNKSRVQAMLFPLPPLGEQRRIVEELDRRLSVADELEAVVDHSLRRADRLRQSILKRAFEGKLVPQDPSDEPASALLERIRAERSSAGQAQDSRREGRGRRGRSMRQGAAVSHPPVDREAGGAQ